MLNNPIDFVKFTEMQARAQQPPHDNSAVISRMSLDVKKREF